MIVRDDKTRTSCENFLRGKRLTPRNIEQGLTDIRLHSLSEIILLDDDASELKGEKSSMRFSGNIASGKI